MKILITIQVFANYTGSEVSTLELAKQLVKQGNEVVIVAAVVGNPMFEKAIDAGIDVYDIQHLRGSYDIIHYQHKPITLEVLKLYGNTDAVMHVRSEVIPDYEAPVIHDSIKAYISIRDSITDYIQSYGISAEDIVHIDNPFDTDRFNSCYEFSGGTRERILFVGTMDYLRKAMLFDAARLCRETQKDLWIVGEDSGGYLKELEQKCILSYFGVRQDVESFYKIVDYTVGINNGRTTTEGWLMDVPAWVYIVDNRGRIKSKKLVSPPIDLRKYSAEYSCLKVMALYNSIKAINDKS